MKKLLVFLAMVMISAIMFAEDAAPKKFYVSASTDLFNTYSYKVDGEKTGTDTNFGLNLYETGVFLGYNVTPNIYAGVKVKGYQNSYKPEEGDKTTTTTMKGSVAVGYFMDNRVWFEVDLNLINETEKTGSEKTKTSMFGLTGNVGYSYPITDYLGWNIGAYIDYAQGKNYGAEKSSMLGFGVCTGPSTSF